MFFSACFTVCFRYFFQWSLPSCSWEKAKSSGAGVNLVQSETGITRHKGKLPPLDSATSIFNKHHNAYIVSYSKWITEIFLILQQLTHLSTNLVNFSFALLLIICGKKLSLEPKFVLWHTQISFCQKIMEKLSYIFICERGLEKICFFFVLRIWKEGISEIQKNKWKRNFYRWKKFYSQKCFGFFAA